MSMAANPDVHATARSGRWLAVGFVAGAVAVPIFHQGVLALLYAAGLAARPPYSTTPTAPFGVPQLWSLAFWGGVWGIVLAAFLAAARSRPGYWWRALLFGAVAPTLVAWFVVAPLKGQPLAGGWQPAAMLTAILVNTAWGVGAALVLRLLGGAMDSARPQPHSVQ